MDKEKILAICKELKELCGAAHGMCLEVSTLLQLRLKDDGIKAKIIQGTFQTDIPFDFDDAEDFNGLAVHYWVELDGYILDLTAEQFNDEIDGEVMPSIVFEKPENLPRYRKGKPFRTKKMDAFECLKEIYPHWNKKAVTEVIAELGL